MSRRHPVTGAFQAPRLIEHQSVLRVSCKLLVPFIIMFAVYVITHGELGPGGGFQGGVIMAAAFIFYGLVFGASRLVERIPSRVTDFLMAAGVLLYAGVGLHNLLSGSNFLDYSALNPAHPSEGEALGMTLVEYGVGITVTSVFITIYVTITEPRFMRSKRENVKVTD
jgi:multicomponent Na+:H+ antiporter subunit B